MKKLTLNVEGFLFGDKRLFQTNIGVQSIFKTGVFLPEDIIIQVEGDGCEKLNETLRGLHRKLQCFMASGESMAKTADDAFLIWKLTREPARVTIRKVFFIKNDGEKEEEPAIIPEGILFLVPSIFDESFPFNFARFAVDIFESIGTAA